MQDRLIDLIHGSDLSLDSVRLADHLLANGVIVLPCKVGDTVYIPNIFLKKVYKYRVNEINIGAGNNNVVVLDQYFSDFILPRNCAIYFNQFGKTVFLSQEEAEAKMKAVRNEKQR